MTNFGSVFREAAADMANAVQDVMGECITIIAMAPPAPNFPSTDPDPNRPAITVSAVYTHKPIYAFDNKKSYRATGATDIEMAPLITTSEPRFCVRLCELPWPVRPLPGIEPI